MATGITIVKEFTVRPTIKPSSNEEHIQLTPFDLQFLLVGPIQKGLLFHNPTSSTPSILDHLKTTLSHTLNFFTPLSGRLLATTHEDGATSFSINSNHKGVPFIHATAHSFSLSDILTPTITPPLFRSFFALTNSLNHQGTTNPLLSVQFTELADAFFIGITLNHCVGDGSSFWHFFNSWAEISRGASAPTRLPVFNRDEISSKTHRVLFPSEDCIPKMELEYAPDLKDRVFHFGKESIAVLKEKAGEGNDGIHISSLQALVCLLWRAVLRGRGVSGDSYSTYKLAVGVRSRTKPKLAEEYFGSATLVGKVTARVGEVVGGGMGGGARLLHGLVAGQTWEEVMGLVENWDESQTLATMGGICGGSLLTGSSPRFDVYGNDFGWGRPVAVRSGGANKVDGKLSVFEGAEPGGIDVEATLLEETLVAMEMDEEFMEAVRF